MNTYEIEGYFGYWGILSVVYINADSYKEASNNLKNKVMKMFELRGGGGNWRKFHCKVIGYRVTREIKPYIKFKS